MCNNFKFVFRNNRFLLLSCIWPNVFRFDMFKEEPASIKNFTELFSIFNFLLNLSNYLTVWVVVEPCRFISGFFNSDKANEIDVFSHFKKSFQRSWINIIVWVRRIRCSYASGLSHLGFVWFVKVEILRSPSFYMDWNDHLVIEAQIRKLL